MKNLTRSFLHSFSDMMNLKQNGIIIFILVLVLAGCNTKDVTRLKLKTARQIINAGDYASLQMAIQSLPPEGGMVQIPPGTYKVRNPIEVNHSDIYLRGSGPATHIINENTRQEPVLLLSATQPEGDKDPEQLWRIQISDMRITGNDKSGDGILARDINELFISNVTVSHHGRDGVRLDHCYENPRITHSNITYNKEVGLNLLGCHDIVVNGNEFEENGDALHCTDGFNLTMSGNNLDDHIHHGVVIENTYGSVLSGNMIEECQGTGIILDRDCYGINLGGNVLAHNGIGVDLKDAHGVAVSANTFTINQTYGMLVRAGSGRITISGNNFSNSYIGEDQVKRKPDDRLAGGLYLQGCRNVLISGNLFSGIQPGKAFTFDQSPVHVVFRDNMIIDSESDHELLNTPSDINVILDK